VRACDLAKGRFQSFRRARIVLYGPDEIIKRLLGWELPAIVWRVKDESVLDLNLHE
jgi:hypothetical protein